MAHRRKPTRRKRIIPGSNKVLSDNKPIRFEKVRKGHYIPDGDSTYLNPRDLLLRPLPLF